MASSLAAELGYQYCLKTRSDWRINKPNAIAYLFGLMTTFPVIRERDVPIRERIIAASMATLKYRIYSLADTLVFGRTEDMLKYWSCGAYEDDLIKYGFGRHPCVLNETPVISEIFLCARFLKNLGENLEWTLPHWWKMLRNYFCIVDADSLDIIWPKYDWHYEKRFYRAYGALSARALEFSDWLALYAGLEVSWDKIPYKERWIVKEGELKCISKF